MNELSQHIEEEESIDIKKWMSKIVSNWYWFFICGIIGVVLGFGYSRISQEKYELNSLLLAEKNQNVSGMQELFSSQLFGTNSNLKNHIGTLNSYSIIKQALINLDWRVYWYREKYLKTSDLYKNSPFEINEESGYLNVPEIRINVKAVTDSTYQISVDDEVKIEGNTIKISIEQQGKFGELFANNYFNFVLNKTNYQLIDSESVYFFVFKDLNALALSYKERAEISAYDEESDLILMKITGNHPQREVDFLNRLIDDYIEFGLRKKNQISDNTILFIDKQLGGIVESLQTSGDNFTNFRSKNRIVDLGQEAELAIEQLKKLEYEETLVKMRYEYYVNLQKYLGDAKQMENMVAPSVVGITDPSLNALVMKLSELHSKRNALSSSTTRINPARIAMDKEITYTKQILDENLKNLISNVTNERNNFEDQKNTLNYKLSNLPKTEQNLIDYKRKFDINNELYTFLMQKSAEAAITKASNVSDIHVFDYAAVETAKFMGLNKNIYLVIGLMIGLAFQLLILIVEDFFNNTIKGEEDIEMKSRLPIIGKINRNKHNSYLPIINHPHAGISESIRALRTNLHFILSQSSGSVISIHSSIPGEGKSFLSANLAASIALNNKKVLLVGADLRMPKLDQFLNLKNNVGLSTFIAEKISFEDVIQQTHIKNLFFVASGPIPPNPSELLDTERFKNFLSIAKQHFDYVIFDNAPTFRVTDPIIIGNLSDVNLFVIRQNYTKKDNLKIINDFETQGTIKKMYLVFNDVKRDGFRYNNMYGKEYGSYTNIGAKTNKKRHTSKPVETEP